MKMPAAQSSENSYYEYDHSSYYGNNVENENNGVEEYDQASDDIFSEYLWMENEEEFDKEVMQRLEEEALMEQCIEAMLADEVLDSSSQSKSTNDSSNEVSNLISNLKIDSSDVAKESNLNPLAAEFVPGVSAPQVVGTSP